MQKTAKELIDDFKTEIDLVAFLEKDGYQIDKSEGVGKFIKMKHSKEDTLLVYKTDNNQYRFTNRNDSSDKGNIIDYVAKTRKLNLVSGSGDWKLLFNELNSVLGGNLNVRNSSTSNVLVKTVKSSDPSPVNDDLKLLPYRDHSYLNERGLDSALLNSEEFKGKIFNRKYFNKGEGEYGMNTVFPLENINGFIGVNIRNKDFNGVYGVKNDGLWISNVGRNAVTEMFITESAIDALSYHKLNPVKTGENRLYLATLGEVSQEQKNSVQYLINKTQPQKIILGNDNDRVGKKFNINFIGQLQVNGQNGDISCNISQNNKKAEATLTIEFKQELNSTQKENFKKLVDKIINERIPADLDLKKAEAFIFHEDSEKTMMQVKIPNTLPFLGRTENFVRNLKSAENIFVIAQPLKKDFNEDLIESLKKVNQRQIKTHSLKMD